MNKTQISVIIPAYNEEKYLQRCLDSVKNQKTNLNYEIIVVNNNSKDKTEEIAKKNNVIVVNEKKKGVGSARKAGTQKAKGEIIIHIDADTVLYPNHLKKVWEYFKKEKNLACLGGQFLFYDAPLWKKIARKIIYKPLVLFSQKTSKNSTGPMGNNMAFRKSLYKKTTGFDENLKFGEDSDICKKLKKFGDIKVDMNLKVETSARRYKIDKKLFLYTRNFLHYCLYGKPYKNVLPKIKED